MSKRISVYIHIPFCFSRCAYCDFNTYAGIDYMVPGYIDAVIKEMALRLPDAGRFEIDTIFIGGGTPSYIEDKYICSIMDTLKMYCDTESIIEATIEANPGTLDCSKLDEYIRKGINRLSIGLQCWQQGLLGTLGRSHTAADYIESMENARKAGFKNINTDLIFGIPGQTLAQLKETLSRVIDTGTEHVSCYSLKLEAGTPLAIQAEKGVLEPVSDETDREMYHLAVEILREAGYRHYEISNFSLPGYECRHNMVYWNCGEYIGLGAGAHSYLNGYRVANTNSITDYIDKINSGTDAAIEKQYIDREESMKEYMILGLRLVNGISRMEFKDRFGVDLFSVFDTGIRNTLAESLIEIDDDRIRLTKKGLDLANRVFLEFI